MASGSGRLETIGVAASAGDRADAHRLWDDFLGALWRQVPSVAAAGALTTVAASGQSFVLAALLGPESFGSLVFLLATIDLLRSVVDPYVFDPTLRFAGEYDARGARRHAYAVALIAGGVDLLSALTFVFLVWVGGGLIATHILGVDVARILMVLYAATVLSRPIMTVSRVVFSVDGRPDIPQWFEFSEAVVRGIVCIVAVLLGYGIAGVVVGYFAAAIAVAALALPRAITVARRRWERPSMALVREVLAHEGRRFFRFGAINNANFLLSLPSKQLDSIVVGMMLGPQSVGFLRIAKALAASVGLIVGPLQAVTYPRVVSIVTTTPGAARSFVSTLALRIGPLAGVAALLGAGLLPIALVSSLGTSYRPAAMPSMLLFVGACVWLATFWVRPVLLALDRVSALAVMTMSTSAVALASYGLILPRWGLVGHTAAMCIVQVIVQIGGGWYALHRRLPRRS